MTSTSGSGRGTSDALSASPDRKTSKPRELTTVTTGARVRVLGSRSGRPWRRAEHPDGEPGYAHHVARARHRAVRPAAPRCARWREGGVGVAVAPVDVQVGGDPLEDLGEPPGDRATGAWRPPRSGDGRRGGAGAGRRRPR